MYGDCVFLEVVDRDEVVVGGGVSPDKRCCNLKYKYHFYFDEKVLKTNPKI